MNPQDLRYTDQHEWVKLEGKTATVGISDHAQKALGDMTFVELPKIGKKLRKGEEACALESCKAAASVYAPASGTISAANDALADDPGIINKDCYGQGWIYKITVEDPAELDSLISAEQYSKYLGE